VPIWDVAKPIGPHTEALLILDIAADATIELWYGPEARDECYLLLCFCYDGSDLDVFEVTVAHPDIAPHSVTLTEGFMGLKYLERPCRATRDRPLYVKVRNKDTHVKHHLEGIFYMYHTAPERADAITREAEKEIDEYIKALAGAAR